MPDPTPGPRYIRVTATPDTVLRHAYELATRQTGQDSRYERQARGLDELGYRIIPKRDEPRRHEPGTLGEHWAVLRRHAAELPAVHAGEIADVLARLEVIAEQVDSLGWPGVPTFHEALDTLRALLGAEPGDTSDEETPVDETEHYPVQVGVRDGAEHVPVEIGTRDDEGRRTFAPPGDVCAGCSDPDVFDDFTSDVERVAAEVRAAAVARLAKPLGDQLYDRAEELVLDAVDAGERALDRLLDRVPARLVNALADAEDRVLDAARYWKAHTRAHS